MTEKEWIPSAKHGTSGSTHRNVEPRGYEDIFNTWDEQCVSPLPLLRPGTGQPLTASDTPCPTFRPPRPRTPQAQRPSLPRSTTLPLRPVSVMQASPLSPSRYSAYGIIPSEASHSSPTRPSSNRSASSLAKSADASRSSSVASSRARSDPLPVQPGPHNSIAEMRARQVNMTHVQQPVRPYTGLCSPLNAARHAVSGRLKKRSNTLDLGVSVQGEEERLSRRGSWKRLEGVFGKGRGDVREGRDEKVISKNFERRLGCTIDVIMELGILGLVISLDMYV